MTARLLSAPPPGFTVGFATLIEGEAELARALGAAARGLEGPRASATARIFEHQVRQLDAVVALLMQRRAQFPLPQRFERDAAQHPRATQHHAGVGQTEAPTLAGFHRRHLAFATRLGELVASTASGANREELLREAKQFHEEMAWMLAALINEDLTAERRPRPFPPDSPFGRRPELERWETDGGGIAPPGLRSDYARQKQAGAPPIH